MRISRSSLSLYLPDGRAVDATSSAASPRGDQSGNPLLETANIQTTERAGLLEQLAQTPEFRQDVMQDVVQRVHSGNYLSRVSAERTADALLEDYGK